jgi:hypothetical protein
MPPTPGYTYSLAPIPQTGKQLSLEPNTDAGVYNVVLEFENLVPPNAGNE